MDPSFHINLAEQYAAHPDEEYLTSVVPATVESLPPELQVRSLQLQILELVAALKGLDK